MSLTVQASIGHYDNPGNELKRKQNNRKRKKESKPSRTAAYFIVPLWTVLVAITLLHLTDGHATYTSEVGISTAPFWSHGRGRFVWVIQTPPSRMQSFGGIIITKGRH